MELLIAFRNYFILISLYRVTFIILYYDQQLFHKLSHSSYMFRHYCVILREVVVTSIHTQDSVHTEAARRVHQHTDCIYSHNAGLHENYNNITILVHFIINRTI